MRRDAPDDGAGGRRGARVAVAGATGYTGQELLRLLARHPAVTVTAAMSSGATAPQRGACRRWRASGTARSRRSRPTTLARDADLVFLALPDAAAAELAPVAGRRRRPRHRSLGRVPAARRRRARRAGIRKRTGCPTAWPTASPSGSATPSPARGSWPTRAAIRRPRCWRSRRSPPPACSSPAPTSSSTPSRACPGAGKTPSERTHFSECHGSLSAYGVFGHRHGAEIEQGLGASR